MEFDTTRKRWNNNDGSMIISFLVDTASVERFLTLSLLLNEHLKILAEPILKQSSTFTFLSATTPLIIFLKVLSSEKGENSFSFSCTF